MLAADPVCVRKVDADRGCRVAVSGECGNVDDLCGHTLHFVLLEAWVYR